MCRPGHSRGYRFRHCLYPEIRCCNHVRRLYRQPILVISWQSFWIRRSFPPRRINAKIDKGSGIIQGSFTQDSANALAIQLRYGSLPIPVKVVESQFGWCDAGRRIRFAAACSPASSAYSSVVLFMLHLLSPAGLHRRPGADRLRPVQPDALQTHPGRVILYPVLPVSS